MKRILAILIILMAAGAASASDWNITGDGGMSWNGNTTGINISQNADYHIELGQESILYDGFEFKTYGLVYDIYLAPIEKHGQILTKGVGSEWDMYGIRDPTPLVNETGYWYQQDGKYVLFYNGRNTTGVTQTKVGRAESTDKLSWTENTSNPIYTDGDYTALGSVIYRTDLNKFLMYYSNGTTIGFCISESTDGTTWTKNNTVGMILEPSDFVGISAMGILYVTKLSNGEWFAVFEGYSGTHYEIFAANSTDGYTWTAYNSGNAIYDPTSGIKWDNNAAANPKIYEPDNGKYLISYNGRNDMDGGTWDAGWLHSTDLTTWTTYTENPVIRRGWSGEWDDQRLEGMITTMDELKNDTVNLYYFGLPTTDSYASGAIGRVTLNQSIPQQKLSLWQNSSSFGSYEFSTETISNWSLGSYVLNLTDDDGARLLGMISTNDDLTAANVNLEFLVYPKQINQHFGFTMLDGSTTGPNMRFSSAGAIEYYTGGSWNNVQSYSANTWYYIQLIDVDVATDTYDIYINGVLKNSGVGYATALSEINTVKIFGWTSTVGTILIDDVRLTNGTTYYTSLNLTSDVFDSGIGNKTSKVRIQGNNPLVGTNITVAINKSTDQSSWTWEELGTVTTVGDFNTTYDVTGNYRYASWDFYAQTNNSSQTPVIYNGSLDYEVAGAAGGAPSITAYYPTVAIWPEVQDSETFNLTANQTTKGYWYVNGSLVQTNATPSLTHAYTNSSLEGGHWNFTAIVNNTNGTDSQTWLFEVGADSVTWIVLKDQPTNQTLIAEWNVTRIGSNITDWGWWQNYTFINWTYYFRFTNDTEIMNQTATSNNKSLWFNHTSLLSTGVYFINATGNNEVILYANKYAMVNNWTTTQNCSRIDANTSNCVCMSWYNHISGLWEGYRSGYDYNADAEIPENNSAFIFIDAQTTVSATPHTGGVTIQNATWFYGMLPETTAKTLTEIETAMDSDGLDVWSLYGWSNASQAYTATGGYSVAPNEGYAVYCNVSGEYTP